MDKKKLQQKLVRITLTDADRLRIGKDLSEAIGRKRNTEMEFDDAIASVDRVKWVSALRGKHGPHKLDERLDTEQRSFPAPGSALDAALRRLTASIADHYDAAKAEKLNAKSSATAGAAGANPEEKR